MSVTFSGDKELLNALEKMARTEVYKEVVQKNGAALQRTAQRKAVFKKGFRLERLSVPSSLI